MNEPTFNKGNTNSGREAISPREAANRRKTVSCTEVGSRRESVTRREVPCRREVVSGRETVSRREAIALGASAGIFSLIGISPFESTARPKTNKFLHKMISSSNTIPAMKTIGIVGGLGPQATTDLEMRIHKVAQQLVPQMQNSGYPSMIVQYYRHAPVLLTEEHMPVMPLQPDPRMLEAARNIGAMADFIVVPSNGVHLFQNEIEQASGRKVVSMIDATLKEVIKRGWRKVGVLGLMNPLVYTTRLRDMGIAFETIDETLQAKLDQAIFKVMEGRENEADRNIAMDAIGQLRYKKVDGIIPGCTEIPFLLGENMNAPDLLNPAQLLAEAAVRYCLA